MNKPEKFGCGSWKAKVIGCGSHITPLETLCAGLDEQMVLSMPYQAFILQGNGFNILIDTGQNERHHPYGDTDGPYTFYSTSVQFLESLTKEGLTPDDIDMVIYTHLHADHAGNANFFPNTKTVVQRDEFYALLNPCLKEKQLKLYDAGAIAPLQSNPNLMLIDGDFELMEGIRLIKTPGHTKGLQSIVVNTVNGIRVFVGDHFHLPHSCFPGMDTLTDYNGDEHSVIPKPELILRPSSLIFNYFDYFDSSEKIKASMPEFDPQYLVCGHDATLAHKDF